LIGSQGQGCPSNEAQAGKETDQLFAFVQSHDISDRNWPPAIHDLLNGSCREDAGGRFGLPQHCGQGGITP